VSRAWSVELVRIGAVAPSVMRQLRQDLARSLAHAVWISPREIDPAPAFDPARGQYLATRLLEMLAAFPAQENVQRIGIAEVDLFLPVFTHVFGAAQLDGTVGVASLHRLRPEFEGDRPDAGRTRSRLAKEVLHELGHTLGLVHCRVPWCAMAASRLPEQVDLKDAAYCSPCAARVGVPEDGFRAAFQAHGSRNSG